ncbi:anti-sigma regulatory factor [Peribacillus kribbensis]|uniref:anti-sigma regulatory factor n=1 Tax=Peribacillus kribbensis TaxID=356658 RepID=UPI000420EC65|nr:anti-sigma regulatory factor [Peribacillus kribbensis]
MTIKSNIPIISEWDIVAARQAGREAAKKMNFGTVDQARITTAISELARNIFLYAMPGNIIVEEIHENNKYGLKITAADQGPGIENIKLALEDGYTTSGGLGAGVPGVKRLMDEFSIDSEVGRGTVVVAVKWL